MNSELHNINYEDLRSYLSDRNDGTTAWDSLVVNDLTVSTALYADASKQLTSFNALTNGQLLVGSTGAIPVEAALTGTVNQLVVTNGAGSVTLSTPQDIHTGASPTFLTETLSSLSASKLISTNGAKLLGSADIVSFVTGTANQLTVTDDGDGTITLSTPQATHTAATPTFAELTITGFLVVDSIGAVTQAAQPSFLVTAPTNSNDTTGDGTVHTVEFDTEIYDQNADFNVSTFTFTAPVTGRYFLSAQIMTRDAVAATHTSGQFQLVTSNRTYQGTRLGQVDLGGDGFDTWNVTALADMDVSDTAHVTITVTGGTKVVDVFDGANNCFFSGSLIN